MREAQIGQEIKDLKRMGGEGSEKGVMHCKFPEMITYVCDFSD